MRAIGSTFQQAFGPCYRYVWKGVAELMGVVAALRGCVAGRQSLQGPVEGGVLQVTELCSFAVN